MSTAAELDTGKKPSWLVQYFLDFKVLKDNPMAFWIVQLINLLDSIAYFAMLGVVTLFLTQTIGQDKVTTGYIVTVFTTLITVSLFIAGFVTDAFGIKKSLLLAQGVHLISRVIIAVCGLLTDLPGRGWIVAVALVLSAPGAAMTQTVFQAANKRLSSRKSRSASFNIWYLIMNIGAMLGGLSIDLVRKDLKVSLAWIFVMGAITAGLNVIATTAAVRQTAQVRGDGEDEEVVEEHKKPKGGMGMLKELVRDTAFWRFIVLMVAVLGVRAVFAYMYLLMPQYWVEVIEQTGSAKTDQGLLQAINPILIVGGLILFIPIANRFNVFKMLVTGAAISALSLIIMVLPWQWFGPTMAQGYFAMSVLMLVVLSLGELIWSPKLTEYTAAIAPHGQEGTYLGLSMVPWFAAKLVVSGLSGHMLNRWVPEGRGMEVLCSGEVPFWNTPEAMWTVLAVWAFAGPVVAQLFSGWLTRGADLAPAEPGPPESAKKFRLMSVAFGVVALAGMGWFFNHNVTLTQKNFVSADGKVAGGQIRSEKEAIACGCWQVDHKSVGGKLCKAAQPADVKDKAGEEWHAKCLASWFEGPQKKCQELCKDSKMAERKECHECAELGANSPAAPATANLCVERVTNLE